MLKQRIRDQVCLTCGKPRDTTFKSCTPCRNINNSRRRKNNAKSKITDKLYRKRRWGAKKVWDNQKKDRTRFTWNPSEYMTEQWVYDTNASQQQRCYYCKIDCQRTNMRGIQNGLQIERLDNKLPHLKTNCVICCQACNSRQFSDLSRFKPETILKKKAWLRQRIGEVAINRMIQTLKQVKLNRTHKNITVCKSS